MEVSFQWAGRASFVTRRKKGRKSSKKINDTLYNYTNGFRGRRQYE